MNGRFRSVLLLCFSLCFLLGVLSPPAQGAIGLPVPSFNQAYRGAFGYWADCRLGSAGCPYTIGAVGCLVTAFAMVLAFYGVELYVPQEESCSGRVQVGIDPGILNDWLRMNDGFGRCTPGSAGNCCLRWAALPPQISLSSHENRSEPGIDAVSRSIIDRALERGRPVIAGVHFWGGACRSPDSNREDCHWVVITGRLGDDYLIIDPYNRDHTDPQGTVTTLSRGVLGAYTIDRFVVVYGPGPAPAVRDLRLDLSFSPEKDLFHPGDIQHRFIRLSGSGAEDDLILYVRLIDPQGEIYYVYYETQHPQPGDRLSYSRERRSLYPVPRRFSTATFLWNSAVLPAAEPGIWTWKVRVEDPAHPGEPLASDIAAYELAADAIVARAPAAADQEPSPPMATAAVALVVGVAIIITALIYALALAQNRP